MEKEQILKIKIGAAVYTITFFKVKGGYSYELKRNKKVFVCGYAPKEIKDNIKMHLMEHLIIQATYQFSHELGKIKL